MRRQHGQGEAEAGGALGIHQYQSSAVVLAMVCETLSPMPIPAPLGLV